MLVATRASRLAKPTSIERAVSSVLSALKVEFLAEHRIGPYLVDFYLPAKQLIVECDGSYWHSLPNVKERDARRDEWLRALGYTVLRLPEPDIRSGAAMVPLAKAAA